MKDTTLINQIMESLAFEIEPISLEDDQVSNSSNHPLNVTIRLRKKKRNEALNRGFISIPKIGRTVCRKEKIRLSSSEQTIMSFNVLMERDETVKQPLSKQKRILHLFKKGGCLSIQNEEEQYEYSIGASKNTIKQNNLLNPVLKVSSNVLNKQNFAIAKNFSNIDASQTGKEKHTDFLGRCKPGGCLDPPFDEDKYTYLPKLINMADEDGCKNQTTCNEHESFTGHNIELENNNINKHIITQLEPNQTVPLKNIKSSNYIITFPSKLPSKETHDRLQNITKSYESTTESKTYTTSSQMLETYFLSPSIKASKNATRSSRDSKVAQSFSVCSTKTTVGSSDIKQHVDTRVKNEMELCSDLKKIDKEYMSTTSNLIRSNDINANLNIDDKNFTSSVTTSDTFNKESNDIKSEIITWSEKEIPTVTSLIPESVTLPSDKDIKSLCQSSETNKEDFPWVKPNKVKEEQHNEIVSKEFNKDINEIKVPDNDNLLRYSQIFKSSEPNFNNYDTLEVPPHRYSNDYKFAEQLLTSLLTSEALNKEDTPTLVSRRSNLFKNPSSFDDTIESNEIDKLNVKHRKTDNKNYVKNSLNVCDQSINNELNTKTMSDSGPIIDTGLLCEKRSEIINASAKNLSFYKDELVIPHESNQENISFEKGRKDTSIINITNATKNTEIKNFESHSDINIKSSKKSLFIEGNLKTHDMTLDSNSLRHDLTTEKCSMTDNLNIPYKPIVTQESLFENERSSIKYLAELQSQERMICSFEPSATQDRLFIKKSSAIIYPTELQSDEKMQSNLKPFVAHDSLLGTESSSLKYAMELQSQEGKQSNSILLISQDDSLEKEPIKYLTELQSQEKIQPISKPLVTQDSICKKENSTIYNPMALLPQEEIQSFSNPLLTRDSLVVKENSVIKYPAKSQEKIETNSKVLLTQDSFVEKQDSAMIYPAKSLSQVKIETNSKVLLTQDSLFEKQDSAMIYPAKSLSKEKIETNSKLLLTQDSLFEKQDSAMIYPAKSLSKEKIETNSKVLLTQDSLLEKQNLAMQYSSKSLSQKEMESNSGLIITQATLFEKQNSVIEYTTNLQPQEVIQSSVKIVSETKDSNEKFSDFTEFSDKENSLKSDINIKSDDNIFLVNDFNKVSSLTFNNTNKEEISSNKLKSENIEKSENVKKEKDIKGIVIDENYSNDTVSEKKMSLMKSVDSVTLHSQNSNDDNNSAIPYPKALVETNPNDQIVTNVKEETLRNKIAVSDKNKSGIAFEKHAGSLDDHRNNKIVEESFAHQGNTEAENANQTNMRTFEKYEVIYLDMAFQSYLNGNNENVIRTLDSAYTNNAQRFSNDNLLQFKTIIKPNDGHIKIPIDKNKDLILKIATNRKNNSRTDKYIKESLETPVTFNTDDNKGRSSPSNYQNKEDFAVQVEAGSVCDRTIMREFNFQQTIGDVYRDKLLPLRKVIKKLKHDIDQLSKEKTLMKEQILKKEDKHARHIKIAGKKCGCNEMMLRLQ